MAMLLSFASRVTRLPIRGLLITTLAIAVLPANAFGQGGPPLITDDPDTPGPGHWEINVAALMEKTRSQRRIEVPRVDLNYGVGRRIQLKFEIPWVAAQSAEQRTAAGVGNATLGVKWRFIGQEGEKVAWSIYPQFDFNAAHSSVTKGIEAEGRQFLMPTEITVEMFKLEINGELGRHFVDNGSRSWIFGLSTEGHVVPRLELLAELHGERATDSLTDLIAVGGGRLKLTSKMIALMAVGHSVRSLSDEGSRTYAYAGLQLNLPRQFTFEGGGAPTNPSLRSDVVDCQGRSTLRPPGGGACLRPLIGGAR
jgi:hypothetical protein